MQNTSPQDDVPQKLKDLAPEIGRPLSTLQRMCREDRIPHIRYSSRDYRIRRSDLAAWLEANTRGPRALTMN